MVGFIFGLVKGAVKGTLVTAVLLAGAGSIGYYKLAELKLPRPEGALVTAGVCRSTGSLSGATLPVTFEAFLKNTQGHNFVASGGAAGLVVARYEWSHGNFAWIEDKGFVERQAVEIAARRKLAGREVGALVKDLRSESAEAREIAARELQQRTGETKGYAYDLPAAEREKAAAAWDAWWAHDSNRTAYTVKRTIDIANDLLTAPDDRALLERFRKALGVETGGAGAPPIPPVQSKPPVSPKTPGAAR